MTEKQLRNKPVNVVKGWLGLNRANKSHKIIIDTYNSFKPLPRNYKVTYSDNYCATTISAAAIKAGLTDIIPRECSCGNMIEIFKRMGRWQEKDTYIPKTGDVIFYDWDDSGKGDCTGWPEHVGYVVSVSGKTITVIEGNKGGKVAYRTMTVNGKYIRGYGVPDYASKASAEEKEEVSSDISGSDLNKSVKWTGTVTAKSGLNVRTWAGKEYNECSFSPLKYGQEVGVCDSVKASDGVTWYYIKTNGKYGFSSSKYINRKE